MQQQSLANRSLISRVRPTMRAPLLASVNPSDAAALRKRCCNRLSALLHAVSVFVFPPLHETGPRQHERSRQPRQPWRGTRLLEDHGS